LTVRETEAKSVLLKRGKIDSWFISRYGMNLYRGCTHNCAYCDGRSENYHVDGTFGEDVAAKINAVGIFPKELNPLRKLARPRSAFILTRRRRRRQLPAGGKKVRVDQKDLTAVAGAQLTRA
jgi:hypothetical protein